MRSKKQEREERQVAWNAEQERVRKLGELFSALPDGHQKEALKDAMTNRIVDLYNEAKFEQGDAILEFLPNDWSRQLLDWYFDEDGTIPHPAKTASGENEDFEPRQIQGEPQIA